MKFSVITAILLLLSACIREPSEVELKTAQFKKDAHCKVVKMYDTTGPLESCGRYSHPCKEVTRNFLYQCDGGQTITEELFLETRYIGN